MKKHYISKTTNALLLSTALGVMSALIPTTAMAQQFWDGIGAPNDGTITGGGGIWGAATNWTSDATGATNEAWTPNGDAVFGGALNGIVEVDGDQNVGDITFSNGGYVIANNVGAGRLVLNAGTSNITNNVVSTISAGITGTGGMSVNGSGRLVLEGNNSFSGGLNISGGSVSLLHDSAAGDGDITITGTGTVILPHAINASNNISTVAGNTLYITQAYIGGSATLSGNITGAGSFIKNGVGEIIFSGNNTYSGTTTIQDGTLTTQGTNAIGDTSAVIFTGAGDTLNIGDNETIGSLAGNGTVNVVAGRTLSVGGNNTDTNYSGLMSTTGNFNKIGTAEMTFSGDDNSVAMFQVTGGKAILTGENFNASTGFSVQNGATLVANNADGNAINDTAYVTVIGTGTFEIQTDETIGSISGSGNVFLNGGDLTFGNALNVAAYGVISGTGGLIKQGTNTQTLSGTNTYNGQTTINDGILNVTGSIANSYVMINNGGQLNASEDALSSGVGLNAGATFQNNGDNTISSIGASASSSIELNAGTLTINLASAANLIAGTISGSGSLTKDGAGILALSGSNEFSGGITVAGGTLSLQNDNAAGTGTITTTGSVIDYANGVNIANPININSNTTQLQVLTGSATQSGIISETGGARPLEKIGAGTLTLSAANTYSGDTTVSAGALEVTGSIASNNIIVENGAILGIYGSSLLDTSTLTMNGTAYAELQADEQIGTLSGVAAASSVELNTHDLTLNVASTSDFAGAITGTGGITKIGSGTQTLSGANTYTGLTTISAGTLSLNGGAAIADTGSGVATGANGTLNIMASETIAAMNNAGAINLANSAIGNNLTIAGDYTGVGVINVDVDFSTDASDIIIIGGDVTGGTTNIVVTDISTGAATGNDILVVDVAGTSNAGDFVLTGTPFTSGAFIYELNQVGMDWFLQQALSPLTATYEVYPQTLLALNEFSSMRQRTSNRVWGEMDNGDKYNGNVWGIIEASHAKTSPTSSTTASTYDNTIWKMKAGVDGVVSENENGKFIVGLNGYYGTSTVNIFSASGNGSIFTQAFGLGLSGTYFANNGFYVDGQLQTSWNYSDLNSVATGALVTDNLGQTYGASLEIGQKIDLGDGLAITPNAQLAYTSATFNSFNGPGGERVSLDYADSLIGRLGIIVENEQAWTGDDGTANSSSIYGLANIYYDLSGASQVDVSGTKLNMQPNKLYGEIGFGGSYDFNDGQYSLTGEASIASSLEDSGNNYQVKGNLGFKAKF